MVQEFKPQMISISSSTENILEELQNIGNDKDIKVGEIKENKNSTDFMFNPNDAFEIVQSIITAIGTVGGAVTFIDWIIDKLKSKKEIQMIIKIGDKKIKIESNLKLKDVEIEAIVNELKAELNYEEAK